MRIIDEYNQSGYKITIFSYEERFTIKIENGSLVQEYKVRSGPMITNLTDIRNLVDDKFINGMTDTFKDMHQHFGGAQKRLIDNTSIEFDDIV